MTSRWNVGCQRRGAAANNGAIAASMAASPSIRPEIHIAPSGANQLAQAAAPPSTVPVSNARSAASRSEADFSTPGAHASSNPRSPPATRARSPLTVAPVVDERRKVVLGVLEPAVRSPEHDALPPTRECRERIAVDQHHLERVTGEGYADQGVARVHTRSRSLLFPTQCPTSQFTSGFFTLLSCALATPTTSPA